jgi:uncharacterized glyoxalase superfamily protein PhnB
MTDPLDALLEPIVPVEPDPLFAAELRARLERALLALEETTMTTTTGTAGVGDLTPADDLPLHTLTPYIGVDDARRALDWYVEVFGARRRGQPMEMPGGRIGHAELAIGDSVLMLADEAVEMGLLGPHALGGVSHTLMIRVPDVDATVGRAVARGAELTRPVASHPYGRTGVVNDPFGHRWMIITPAEPARSAGQPDK